MIVTAFFLATATVAGFTILYTKMPNGVKKYLKDHSLMTDIIACVATYWLHAFFGGGATVLFAAGIASLETSVLLSIAKDPEMSAATSLLVKKMNEFRTRVMDSVRKALVSYEKRTETTPT